MAETPVYDAIFHSPHLDDAVLSCGGQLHRLARQGRRVLVVTWMAGDPPAELSPLAAELHRTWSLADSGVLAARRREDRAAAEVLGVEVRHERFPDALYRQDPATGEPLYPTLRSLFRRRRPADDSLLEALVARLAELPSAARWLAPLGAGRHVDHLLVRAAAERGPGGQLELWEDYPYARDRWALRKARGWPLGWRSRLERLAAEDVDARCRACRCYASQLGTAFADLDDMEAQVREMVERIGGERLWRNKRWRGG